MDQNTESCTSSTSGDTPSPEGPSLPGRRERKKRDTRRRIVEAAQTLFARDGYSAVTTQQIAQAAGVGAGTLFRYAQSKAELLIMVMNEHLRLGAERGLTIAQQGGTPAEAIYGLVEPLAQAGVSQPENTSVFHREVLFGAEGPNRTLALRQIRELEEAMAAILALARDDGSRSPDVADRRLAEIVFSVVYLKLVRLELGRVSAQDLAHVLRQDIDGLMAELHAKCHP